MCPAGPGCFVCPAGPGCFVCPWAAARPLAVRAASFARRVVSKPGQAPPPPTGTAARPHVLQPARALRSLRRPSHQWRLVADVARCVASKPGQASPPPTGTAARPSGPSGALHTSGAWPLWCRPWASQGPSELRFLADLLLVVTNVVNPRCFSCGFLVRCYERRQSEGFFAENQGFWTQIDDVCNKSPRKGLHIAPV